MGGKQVEIKKASSKGLLWHFTSVDALPKILLGDDGLLAGSTVFMDDGEDCSLSRRLLQATIPLRQVISKSFQRGTLPSAFAAKYCACGLLMPTFAASFTKEVDNQIMWQIRTRLGGVAIGFDWKRLEDAINSQEDNCFAVLQGVCDYDSYYYLAEEIETISQELKLIHDSDNRTSSQEVKLAKQLWEKSKKLAPLLVFCKKRDFKWENEFRFAYVCADASNLRDRLRFINGKPFVTMKLPERMHIRDFVREIKVSPYGDTTKTKSLSYYVGDAIGLSPGVITEWEFV